jgi:hypothetical protein
MRVIAISAAQQSDAARLVDVPRYRERRGRFDAHPSDDPSVELCSRCIEDFGSFFEPYEVRFHFL